MLAGRRMCGALARRFVSASATSTEPTLPLSNGPSSALPHQSERDISAKVGALVEDIAQLTVIEVADLNWALKKRLNLPDVPMGGMQAFAMPAASTPAAAEETAASDAPQKMTFAVKLTKFNDAQKIALIKEIRTIVPGLNLVQAKKFVETAPVTVKEDMGKAEADELKAALEKVGATCEIA
ncbi:unnamed protein product, partial [Mesorhabditis spiculigera]